jgi:hypothetical protein
VFGIEGGRTIEDVDSVFHPATYSVLVVSMELCESLLCDCCPDGLIFTHGSKNSVVTNDWEAIIDDLSEWNTNCEEIQGINTILIDFIVDENLIDSPWDFSDGRDSRHEPAVADVALVDILRSDSIAPESVVLEIVLDSLPLDAADL